MQRIQSLFLIITIIAAIMFANVDYIKLKDGKNLTTSANIKGVFDENGINLTSAGLSTIPLTSLAIFICLSSLVTIFLYRNRKVQIRIIMLIVASEIAMGGLFYYGIKKMSATFDGNYIPSLSLFLIAIMIIASLLAFRGVRSDEKLIESLNRLR